MRFRAQKLVKIEVVVLGYPSLIFQVILGLLLLSISVCRLRERGHMSKSVYVRVFHDLELLRYVLRCEIERQL